MKMIIGILTLSLTASAFASHLTCEGYDQDGTQMISFSMKIEDGVSKPVYRPIDGAMIKMGSLEDTVAIHVTLDDKTSFSAFGERSARVAMKVKKSNIEVNCQIN